MTSVIKFYCIGKEQLKSLLKILPYKNLATIKTLIDDIQFSHILFKTTIHKYINNMYYRIKVVGDNTIYLSSTDGVVKIAYRIYPDGRIEERYRAYKGYNRYDQYNPDK